MNAILPVYKPVGLTPLQLIQKVRSEKPEFESVTIAYAGRLDPMAEGIMLLMVGEATKERGKYLSLDKTYQFVALLGIETDTYDSLGLLQAEKTNVLPNDVNNIVNTFVKSKVGLQKQTYPPFSSKTVDGKPLFMWAKEKKLSEISLPTHEVSIYSLTLLKMETITKDILKKQIATNLSLITGDFRQEEIKTAWEVFFQNTTEESFTLLSFEMHCSSGTYVRQLVHELGIALGCGAVTLGITRTKIGEFEIKDSLFSRDHTSTLR